MHSEDRLKASEERHRRQSGDLALLHQVRTALAQELDLWSVFYTVVEAIAKTYGYSQVSAYLLEGGVLVLQHGVGYERAIERIPVTEGVSGRAVRTGQPILLEDVRSDSDFIGAIEGITSEICVPLFDEEEVVGFFNVESTNGVRLTQDDLELMVALGEHVSVAVSRAQLYTRVQRSEERFRAMTQNSSDLVTLLTATGTIRYQSPSVERILGYRPEELIGENVFNYVHPDDLGQVEMAFAEGLKDPKRRPQAEYRFWHKDGSWRWLESVGSNLLGDPGVGEYVVNSRDITERKEAEEALSEAEERYRTLVEQIPAVTYIDRADGSDEPLYTSPQIEKMLGYTPEEWLEGRLWPERLHPEDRERMLAADGHFEAGGSESFSEEYRLVAKDGAVVWVREEAVLVEDERGNPLFWQGVLFNITEQKQAEEELRESEERLRRLADSAFEGILITEEGEILEANRAFIDMLGYEVTEVVGRSAMEFVASEHQDLVWQKISSGAEEPYEIVGIRKDGTALDLEVRGRAFSYRGRTVRVTAVRDITERKAFERRLQHQALHDALTELPNRQLFMDRLGQALRRTRRRNDRKTAVLYMDLDDFKAINDSLGHEAGDDLLKAVGERLWKSLRQEDTLARFGGDEFTVLIEEVEDPDDADRVAEQMIEVLRGPFTLNERKLFVRPSIGIALGDARTKTAEDLLRDADTAMYRAKDEGLDYKMFDEAMYEQAIDRLELENDLRRAIEREEFVVHYQPIVDLRTGRLWGFEALVRWDHPERGLLDPDEFVPVAEESGLVVPLGGGVLKEACRQAKAWQQEYPHTPPLIISVNLSAKQLQRPDLDEAVERALRESRLDASCLSLDVTESEYVNALEGNTATLDGLRAIGVKTSIDDFGMGYSSLSYLKRLPADALKIDKTFVKGLGENVEDTAIVRMVIELAHTLGMEVIAEGVESWGQAALLEEMGCDLGQGYHFSKPLTPEGVQGFLEEEHTS